MRIRPLIAALLLALVGLGLHPAPAHAATTWKYSGTAGATWVKALGTTVSSELTAASSVSGGHTGKSTTNSTAAADIAGLISTGAVQTWSSSASTASGGVVVRNRARTAGVNLLTGLVRIDAIETNASTTGNPDGSSSYTAGTTVVGLHVVGVDVPVKRPRNWSVTIPGVASIVANYSAHAGTANSAVTQAYGLVLVLLQPRNGFPAGTTIIVNPIKEVLAHAGPSAAARMLGGAYGTRVQANVSTAVQTKSGPTAFVATPSGSSHGRTLTNTTAGVSVPSVLTTQAVASTSWSDTDAATGYAEMRNSNEVAGLNLLNGLITADAVKVQANGKKTGTTWAGSMRMTLVNLVVAGQSIPINVSPNTKIDVAGLGTVTINQQTQYANVRLNVIRAIHIKLSTERAGLPAGAEIEVAVASTQIM